MPLLPSLAIGLFVLVVILWKPLAADRSRLRTAISFLALAAGALLFNAAQPLLNLQNPLAIEIATAFVELAAVQVGVLLLFDLLLSRLRLPKFAIEMAIAGGYVTVVFTLLYRLGVNVTGIFATSAVATAVVGLALQDMLGNIAGGIALELEGGIRPGDYIRTDHYAGWVEHVRLRHTAVRTADGDRIILPNSYLTKSAVVITLPAHRHFVPFTMAYSRNPQEVIEAVQFALRASPIPMVSMDPPPLCLLRKMEPTCIEYAAVVWLSDPGQEVVPVSAVLARISFALRRAGMPAESIGRVVEMRSPVSADAPANPVDVLRRTPIFRGLDDAELFELGASMRPLAFAPGELILRQDDTGDSMYFVVSGEVGITLRGDGGEIRQIARFGAGDFFGEASLLTGERRTATATAVSAVDCYRLDKDGLAAIVNRRTELAEDMSVVMAHRLMELAQLREKLDQETAFRRAAENQPQLLARIRRFFNGGVNSAGA